MIFNYKIFIYLDINKYFQQDMEMTDIDSQLKELE
jgi:hypothetical protein